MDKNSEPINLISGVLIDADSHVIVRRAPISHQLSDIIVSYQQNTKFLSKISIVSKENNDELTYVEEQS